MGRAGFEQLAGVLATRFPSLVYGGVSVFAGAASRWRAVPSPEAVSSVMPDLSPAAARAASRRSWTSALRLTVLRAALARGGLPAVRKLVADDGGLSRLEPPVLLCSFHVGPFFALGAALERLRGRVVLLRQRAEPPAAENVERIEAFGSERRRIRAMHSALSALKAGSSVFLTVDPGDGASVRAPFFGGEVAFARGAFALARLTGVPLTPMVARWEARRVRVELGPPIEPRALEDEMAAALARWFEGYLRAHPGELSTHLLDCIREASTSDCESDRRSRVAGA